MEVTDRLPGPGTAVGHEAEAVFCNALGTGDVGRGREDAPEQLTIGLGQVEERRHVATRDDEDVGGGARSDVAEGDDAVVLVHDRRG